ncbi:MAG: DUF3857 domain-containing protein [Xanthomonadales bacterium]|nr:DUF3857 domain-containing protein [Xanthomonadales bacterium]
MAVEQERSNGNRRGIGPWFRGCLGGWLILLAMSPAQAEIDEIRRTPAASWVLPVERGAIDDKLLGQISGGSYYLLSDVQINTTGERSVYRRYASKAINAAGVDSLATIEIGFDPAYQTLELNAIDLIRDGRTIPKLADATLRVLQRETELDRRIYDGSKSATIFLEDVRVGDIVDYAYTVHGRNPVFDGREFGTLGLQFGVPIARLHARLLAPSKRDIQVLPRNSAIEARVGERNGLREHEWDQRNIAPLLPDADAPAWYDPYPVVQWSEFADWQAVANWALPLYAVPKTLSPELEAEVARIAKAEPSPEGRLLAALRFVQGEIRYLGVEVGPGSHAPNPPDQVLARRFGDCKDKTLLTVTLLDRLGIEAHPALVDTDTRRALAKRMPSPGQFDHVIVQAKLGDRTIWLDPTRATQNADLAHLVQPDFDLALVIDARGRGLVSMDEGREPAPARLVKATFDARAGLEDAIPFTVVTTLEGERAESMRNTLATNNFEELQKSYLNFYAEYYSGLEIAEPMQVKDDERTNRIITTERYRIPKFSTWSEEKKQHTADIQTPDLDEKLRSPKSTIRNAPLSVSRTSDLTLITETLLPEAWPIKPDTVKVNDPAFSFERAITPKGNRLVITDRFKSLVDEVAAADTARYANHLAEARDQINYYLYWGQPAPAEQRAGLDRINWLLLVIGAMALGFWAWLSLKLYRYDPLPKSGSADNSPLGLGGWLVLPGIGLIASPIVALFTLYSNHDAWAADTWGSLTTFGNPGYHAMWAPALLFELIMQLGVFAISILVAILFFRRRSSLPRIYIGFQIAASAQLLVDQLLVNAIPQAAAQSTGGPQLIGGLIGTAIWIMYFIHSVRVRNTFVVRRDLSAVSLPGVPREAFSL